MVFDFLKVLNDLYKVEMIKRRDNVNFWTRIVLLLLLSAGAIFDLWSTFRNHVFFEGLETNLFVNSFLGAIGIKLLVITFLCVALFWRGFVPSDFFSFFYVSVVVILIFSQFMVGLSNVRVTESIKDHYGYDSVGQVTVEDVRPFVADVSVKRVQYWSAITGLVYFPLFFNLLCFVVWRFGFK